MNRAASGKKGENRAAAFLEEAGLHVVARNVRSPYGEVDVIALDGDDVVFVEVKAWNRLGYDALAEGVGRGKQRRIIETARDFLSKHTEFDGFSVRFDVIFIRGGQCDHIVSAFVEET